MSEKKVIQNLGLVDYLFLLIPPILLVLTSFAVLVGYKNSGLGGALGVAPLIGAIIFGGGIFFMIALVSALLLRSKLIFRIIVGIVSLPLLFGSFSNLVEVFR